MQVGIELVSAALGCGLAAVMSWLAIEGLFRVTFIEQGGAVVAPPRPPAHSPE